MEDFDLGNPWIDTLLEFFWDLFYRHWEIVMLVVLTIFTVILMLVKMSLSHPS